MSRPCNTADNFWRKVNKTPNCWEWTAGKDKDGYGYFRFTHKMTQAHRLSWILTYGDISGESCVLHKCDNPSCVNPEHLFLGDQRDNMADCCNKGRQAKGETVHTAVLTEVDVRVIRRLRKEGMSYTKLALMFDCARMTIFKIDHRQSWKHVI